MRFNHEDTKIRKRSNKEKPSSSSCLRGYRFLSTGALVVGLFLTADQQGQRLMDQGKYTEAADVFEDPMRKGVALYRAGEFKKAEMEFRQLDTPEAHYNRGNCLVFLGLYEEASKSYGRALELRPEWEEAKSNRTIAEHRAKMLERTGGDMGDQKIGADEIQFDKPNDNKGQETVVEDPKEMQQQDIQALWLRRVQTNPADFLKSKFAYQQAMSSDE